MSNVPAGRPIILGLLFLLSVSASSAGEGEFGVQVGAVVPDDALAGVSTSTGDFEPTLGLRGGYRFADHWSWVIDGWFSDIERAGGDVSTLAGRTGFEALFGSIQRKHRWFLTFGGGMMSFDPKGSGSESRPFGSLSLGQRLTIGEQTYLRWELRGDQTLDDKGFVNEDFFLPQFNVGISWGIGGVPDDADDDGIYDRFDRCPDTPDGARVDGSGCPKDSDADGIADGVDRCEGTETGWAVTADGCPADNDGDGVVDGIDACPGTPVGATVDDTGCPLDQDLDGVADGIDRCPETKSGMPVDDQGCPLDSDGDGVFDGLDSCARTPAGAVVDARGCPNDEDGDGVFDGVDRCPSTMEGWTVDTQGCPTGSAPDMFGKGIQTLILEGVHFDFNEVRLELDSMTVLDQVARSLIAWPDVRVEIGGHTDGLGDTTYNQLLSKRRADAVRGYLVAKGVATERLTTRGYGSTKPVADNSTEEGREKNRRVELTRTNGL